MGRWRNIVPDVGIDDGDGEVEFFTMAVVLIPGGLLFIYVGING